MIMIKATKLYTIVIKAAIRIDWTMKRWPGGLIALIMIISFAWPLAITGLWSERPRLILRQEHGF